MSYVTNARIEIDHGGVIARIEIDHDGVIVSDLNCFGTQSGTFAVFIGTEDDERSLGRIEVVYTTRTLEERYARFNARLKSAIERASTCGALTAFPLVKKD